MEDKIQQHIAKIADECLAADSFASRSEEEKKTLRVELENHLYQVMFDTLIDNLDDIQLAELQSVTESEEKASDALIRFAAEVPNFLSLAEEAIKKEAEAVKQTGTIPSVAS